MQGKVSRYFILTNIGGTLERTRRTIVMPLLATQRGQKPTRRTLPLAIRSDEARRDLPASALLVVV